MTAIQLKQYVSHTESYIRSTYITDSSYLVVVISGSLAYYGKSRPIFARVYGVSSSLLWKKNGF